MSGPWLSQLGFLSGYGKPAFSGPRNIWPVFANGQKAIGPALSGLGITTVTNLFPHPYDNTSWTNKSANVTRISGSVLQYTGVAADQIGQNNISLTAGHTYIVIVEARALTSVNNTSAYYYPSLNIDFTAGNNAFYMPTLDYQVGTNGPGCMISLRPDFRLHSARFINPVTGTTGNMILRDDAGFGIPFQIEISFVGIYDITGLSGVIYDATANKYFSLENNVTWWGDSLSGHLWQTRDACGHLQTNRNGEVYFTGDLTATSPTIANVSSTTNLAAAMTLIGSGIPAGTTILSVGAGTITMSANATQTVTGGTIDAQWSGGGKTTSQILANFQSFTTAFPTYLNQPALIWMGHNNTGGAVTMAQTKADFQSLIGALQNDYRILTCVYNSAYVNPRTTDADFLDELNDWLIGQYGPRVVDVRPVLINNGNGSAQDTTDMQWRMTPTSLRLTADAIHVNDRGADLIADAVFASIGNSWS